MTTTSKTEAERLADDAEHLAGWLERRSMAEAAAATRKLAAELRRLSAERDALRNELWDARREHDITRGNLKLTRLGRDELQAQVVRLQAQNVTAWNRGHAVGAIAVGKLTQQVAEQNQRDAWGNSQLTEALLAAEAARDAAQAQVARLEADARQWLPFPDNVPPLDKRCAVIVKYGEMIFSAVDTWKVQREDPLGMGGPTIETGHGWCDNYEDDVIAFMVLPEFNAGAAMGKEQA